MKRKRYYKEKNLRNGRGIPYIYKNRVYLGKRPQAGGGGIFIVIACLLENVRDVTGL